MPDDTLLERLQSANLRLAEDNATLLRKVSELEHLVTCREVDIRRVRERHHDGTITTHTIVYDRPVDNYVDN